MALSLDGNTSFIGTEFIKLLNTGSSDLATVEYVDEQVALGGGGGGNVDLSNYYIQTEVDTLLNNKLNVNNPQDITGTLRIDSTNGNGQLIVNAVGAPNDEDFYVNGLSNLGGTLKAQVIQASSNIQTSQQIQSNVINTYSNSNLIIPRNAIPYITLDSQIVDDETVEKIILMKDVEFSGGLSLNTLSVDTLNTIGLNDMVFNVSTLGEFLRFQVSDNTVRVPNTRSFLSQDIYLDNLRPLTFSNDVVLYGGNNANDAYEEYVRLDASAERVNITKATKFENNIQFNVGQNISWTNVFIREVFSSRPEFDLIVNGSTSHMRMWVAGAIRQAITNTTIACKVNIDAEQGITVFNGQQLRTNTVNSNGNNTLVFQRNGSPYITFNSDRININQALHLSDTLFIDTVNKLSMRPSLEGGVNIFDIRNLHPVADNPMVRFRVGEGGGETIVCEMTNNGVSMARNLIVGTAYELRTNAMDTNGDNDLVISRNDVPFLTLDKFTEDTVEKEAIICSKQLRANGNILVKNLQINQFPSGVEYTDFRLHNADSIMRFYVGNSTNANFQITHAGITLNRETTISSVKTNTINSNGDNDSVFQRNGTEYMRFQGSDFTIRMNYSVISTNTYIDNHRPTAFGIDTFFYGNNSADNGYIEYFRFNHANQRCDYFVNINSNSNITCVDLVETSDKRLKDNILDVDEDCSEIVKKVNVKTYNLKSDDPKKNHIGFIAQEIKAILPEKFEAVVNEDSESMGINYGKMSAILWKCCQEQQSKIEHLESRLFELEDIVKDKKKPTPKSKAKAKSKSKAKHVD